MHFANLVIVACNDDRSLEEKVAETMGPTSDFNSKDGGGFWDWYQIGGRWSGIFDGYDPTKDEQNTEVCQSCRGTGRSTSGKLHCIPCDGKGRVVKWPTEWARHNGDVMPIDRLTREQVIRFYRVVTPREVFESERYEPWCEEGESNFQKQQLPSADWLKTEFAGYLCVVVDNHI